MLVRLPLLLILAKSSRFKPGACQRRGYLTLKALRDSPWAPRIAPPPYPGGRDAAASRDHSPQKVLVSIGRGNSNMGLGVPFCAS